MKKALLITALVGSLLYVCVAFFLGAAVKAGVNKFGPRLTQAKVELGSASLSPLTGSGALSDLVVGNPSGWSDQNAFTLGRVSIKVEPRTLFSDPIVVDEIIIDGPEFNYETKFLSSNIGDLLKNIQEFSGRQDAGTAPADNGRKPRRLIVKAFRLTRAMARLGVGTASLPVPLPDLSMDDLGVKEGGLTPNQLASAMMKHILQDIVIGTANAMGKVGSTTGANAAERAKDAAKAVTDRVKSLFGDHGKP